MQKRTKLFPLLAVLASLLILNTPLPSQAKSLNAFLSAEENEAVIRYESLQVLNIKYPEGGEIAAKLDGESISINLKVDSRDTGIQTLLKDMNAYLLGERSSPVQVTDLVVDYGGTLRGLADYAALSQGVTIEMTLTGYVLGEVQGDDERIAKLVDLNWRTFIMSQPVFVQTQEYGIMDINRPSGFLAATMPTLLTLISTDDTISLLNKPALDFSRFGLPMEEWKWQYDKSENVSVIVAVGEIGRPLPEEKQTADFNHDGIPHSMELTVPAPSATIQILGFAKVWAAGGNEAALVYEEPNIISEINPFVVQILVVLGGVMAAIAILVLIKSRK